MEMGKQGLGPPFWDNGTPERVTSSPSVREHLETFLVVTTNSEEAINTLWERLGVGGWRGIVWVLWQSEMNPRKGAKDSGSVNSVSREQAGCLQPSRSIPEVERHQQHVLEGACSGGRDRHFWRKAGKEQALWLVLFRVLIKRLK